MKNVRIVWLLLLAAFVGLMGFSEHAFADSKLNVKKLFDTLDEIRAQIQTLDNGVSTDHTGLSDKLDELKAQIQTHDAAMAAEYNRLSFELLFRVGTVQALLELHHNQNLDISQDSQNIIKKIDAATSTRESCPDSWKKVLPASERFELVMNDEAVLDKETCLVWERSPTTQRFDWYDANDYCYTKYVGGRMGWRLPTVEELASLIDPTQPAPTLPAGHPFTNVQSDAYDAYWSATTGIHQSDKVWLVFFGSGVVDFNSKSLDDVCVWCVRGGHGYDAYYTHN